MKFQYKLDKIIEKNNSLVSVGLDSDFDKLSDKFKQNKHPQFEFNKYVIEQTNDLVCAYKPNSAFYEARGAEGIIDLKKTCDYLREKYSDVIIILDAKRADIGSTNFGYVKYAFEYLGVDAITLHPYLGSEAISNFLERKDKGCIILCRTSNPGGGELQDLVVTSALTLGDSLPQYQSRCPSGRYGALRETPGVGLPLYKVIAEKAVNEWNKNGNVMLVVGATYPKELAEVRKIAGDMTFLVPGIGTQGGNVEKTVKTGLNSKNAGMIINSSRGIIFAEDPRSEAMKLKDAINSFR